MYGDFSSHEAMMAHDLAVAYGEADSLRADFEEVGAYFTAEAVFDLVLGGADPTRTLVRHIAAECGELTREVRALVMREFGAARSPLLPRWQGYRRREAA